jgi:hypothetical protein
MRDPRNWVRPAAALLAGGAAGTALVLLRARRRAQASHRASSGVGRLGEGLERAAERTVQDLAVHTRRLLGRD